MVSLGLSSSALGPVRGPLQGVSAHPRGAAPAWARVVFGAGDPGNRGRKPCGRHPPGPVPGGGCSTRVGLLFETSYTLQNTTGADAGALRPVLRGGPRGRRARLQAALLLQDPRARGGRLRPPGGRVVLVGPAGHYDLFQGDRAPKAWRGRVVGGRVRVCAGVRFRVS
eukprot:4264614-Pyramimonas_sp.AAC.1